MFVMNHFPVFKLLLDIYSWCFKISVPTDFHLVLLCKESDFEIETEIVSPCFQSVTIYCCCVISFHNIFPKIQTTNMSYNPFAVKMEEQLNDFIPQKGCK